MTVEGKVAEGFSKLVADWLATPNESNKTVRLQYLCDVLGLQVSEVLGLRYQLLHRTASALIEAGRFGAATAAMLVHSFSEANDGFDDFCDFAHVMGVDPHLNGVGEGRPIGGRKIILGWVREVVDTT
ncbi:MAG: DUF6946 family protein [Candidatus Thorarchaeota archaeon]